KNESNSDNEPKKKKNKKPLIIFIAAATVVVIGLIVAGIIALGMFFQSKSFRQGAFTNWYDESADTTYIIYNGDVLPNYFSGKADMLKVNGDSTYALFSCDDDLYVADSKLTLRLVGENVSTADICFDGSAIAYVDLEGDLFIYDTASGNIVNVSGNVLDYPVLSPSGKSVLYLTPEDGEDRLYVYTGKKSYKLTGDVLPVGVSDNAKYIYYYDQYKNALYVTDKKYNNNKIGSNVKKSFVFSKDLSSVVFTTDEGTFISNKGGEKILIADAYDDFYPILLNTDGAYSTNYNMVTNAIIYSGELNNTFYVGDYSNVIYVDKAYNSEKVAKNIYYFNIDRASRNLYYLNNDSVLYYKDLRMPGEAVKIADDVKSFMADEKGKYVYYINDEDSFYRANNKGRAKKLADDVDNYTITFDNKILVVTDTVDNCGTLYEIALFGGKKLIDEKVMSLYSTVSSSYYLKYTNDSALNYDVYVTDKGTNFWNALTGVY
ncbi:MAG: hypothetical protein K5669_10245, partial [Lachnospiraceae bacterium]|nr:hypothetical protein [Lachnospiraceae bacterium]